MSTQTLSKANAAFIVAFGYIREGKKAKLYKEDGKWVVVAMLPTLPATS